jgi:transposase
VVKTGAEVDGPCADGMKIIRPNSSVDIADLGLNLPEAKRLLASVQQEIVTAQARDHAARRPDFPRCGDVCRVKEDYRDHVVATLFGQVTLRLRRFRCAACRGIEAGIGWPPHCRSTPELDRLQAHLSAVMTYH